LLSGLDLRYIRFLLAAVAASAATITGAAAASSSLGSMTLTGLVYGGALLYVFSKSAKFSLFKPAEEMVGCVLPLVLQPVPQPVLEV
jgi:ATP/ADP translocase